MTPAEYLRDFAACFPDVEASDGVSVRLFNAALRECVDQLHILRADGKCVHLLGNGGSAAVVAHAQNDLVKGQRVRALVYQDVPLLTACANDATYACSYSLPLQVWLRPKDVVILVSSSGESDNMLTAAQFALGALGVTLWTFTGFKPTNTLRTLGHLNFYVPSSNYGHVELTHAALLHYLTDQLAHA